MWSNEIWPIISAVLYAMNMGIAIYASVTMILRRQDPIRTLSWTAVMVLLPYIGILLYFVFGQNFRKRKIFSRKGLGDVKLRQELCVDEEEKLKRDPQLFSSENEPYKKLVYQNLKNSYALIDYNSDIDFYFDGRNALDAMYKAIGEATNHIHIQTYILEDDVTGNRFADLLIKKAQSGVEVRLLIDGMGCISLKKKFLEHLQQNGVEVLVFSPVRFFMPMSRLNYRNHRKILVIDGKVGFLGGVNIADRYYYGTETGDWHDTHIKVIGESVFSLQEGFLLDRYFVLNRKLRYSKKYYPQIENQKYDITIEKKNFYSQIISSGPDSDWAGIMQCYFTAITCARDHIFIVTPYFTPNETILNAIKVAALGNIDVRVMLPEKADSSTATYSTKSYIGELLEAGVRIYLFKEGFNHSKVMSIDGNISIVGSANMDTRSFEHNFEIMSVLYNSDCAKIVEERFLQDINECDEINLTKWRKRPVEEKVRESFFRLLSPLM